MGTGAERARSRASAGDRSTPPGWSEVGDDCDDGDRWRYVTLTGYADDDLDGAGTGGALAVCTNGALPAGHALTAGDCDPLDGTAWQELVYLYRDSDGDGVTVESAGVVCAGAALPAGYRVAPGPYYYSDCDDDDRDVSFAIAVYPDADGDSYGAGDQVVLCSGGPVVPSGWSGFGGDCAPGDPARWQLLSYAGVDADLDGHAAAASGTVCAGAALPPPYSPWGGEDCDDGDPSRWRLLSGYADEDGDAVGAGSLVEVCTSVALPDGVVESGGDCAPSDPSAWRLLAGYADADDDAVGAGALVEVCTSVALPHGVVASGGDCAPSDPAAWRPLAYTFRDADGDTRTVAEAGSLCVGAQAPAGYTSVRSGTTATTSTRPCGRPSPPTSTRTATGPAPVRRSRSARTDRSRRITRRGVEIAPPPMRPRGASPRTRTWTGTATATR